MENLPLMITDLEFLTNDVAKTVMETMVLPLFASLANKSRKHGHLVLLVPQKATVINMPYPSHPRFSPIVLYEHSLGLREGWEYDFKKIARDKAEQLWLQQNISGNMTSMSHMLFNNNTPFWGGHAEGLIIAAFSGIQPYYDQLLSKTMLAGCIAIAEDHKQLWLEANPSECFV